jgi:hypothetical protein
MMRLTIVTETNTVGKDYVFYDDLNFTQCQIPNNVWALQWYNDAGHIEFNTTIPNEDITSLPAWATACVSVWEAKDYEEKNPPAPTPEQIVAYNKEKAERLLRESDWSVLPDVPLSNKAEWETYRSALRQIAIDPIINPVWPVKPESIWS